MTHRLVHDEIVKRYKSFSSNHPAVDILNETLIGSRFYNTNRNPETQKYSIKECDNSYVASFYNRPDQSTLVTLCNVSEPRVRPEGNFSLIFTKHHWERLIITHIKGQPTWTVARPLYLIRELYYYIFDKIYENTEYAVYVNDNLHVYVYGNLENFKQKENLFDLMRGSSTVMLFLK